MLFKDRDRKLESAYIVFFLIAVIVPYDLTLKGLKAYVSITEKCEPRNKKK